MYLNNKKSRDEEHKKILEEQINYLESLEESLYQKIKQLEDENKNLHDQLELKSKTINELSQEKNVLKDISEIMEDNSKKLSNTKEKFQKIFEKKEHLLKELEQEKIIFKETLHEIQEKAQRLEKSNQDLTEEISNKSIMANELEQEKILHNEVSKRKDFESLRVKKKYYASFAISGIILVGLFVPYSWYMTGLVGQEYNIDDLNSLNSGYVIRNLRGDTVDTHLSWRIVAGDTIHVNIQNKAGLEPELIDIVKQTILSKDSFQVDSSLLHKGPKGTEVTMYAGWQGALETAAKSESLLHIPVNFEILESENGEGDITITLVPQSSADGFSGWTSSIADESQNQILKSQITIFNANTLSSSQLETIVRHEFGHALGLAHSTAPEDLMHPTIQTNFPYISECDVDAIFSLYDGGKNSQVICES